MSTMCVCGHAKSQHHPDSAGLVCDYAGYACSCFRYKVIPKPERIPDDEDEPDDNIPKPEKP